MGRSGTGEPGETVFAAKGCTVTAAGWKGLERAFLSTLKQKPKQEETSPALPELAEGQRLEGADALLKQGTTSPPARFTESNISGKLSRDNEQEQEQLKAVVETLGREVKQQEQKKTDVRKFISVGKKHRT
ncbi:MAG: hypothetical protein K2P26_13105 [Oscillospiraceae bacterium]|nr:hypothetical protein [Oscillospiraceae bacterium]